MSHDFFGSADRLKNEFDLYKISDGARVLLTARAAGRACLLLPRRGITHAHRSALRAAIDCALDWPENAQSRGKRSGAPRATG